MGLGRVFTRRSVWDVVVLLRFSFSVSGSSWFFFAVDTSNALSDGETKQKNHGAKHSVDEATITAALRGGRSKVPQTKYGV